MRRASTRRPIASRPRVAGSVPPVLQPPLPLDEVVPALLPPLEPPPEPAGEVVVAPPEELPPEEPPALTHTPVEEHVPGLQQSASVTQT